MKNIGITLSFENVSDAIYVSAGRIQVVLDFRGWSKPRK